MENKAIASWLQEEEEKGKEGEKGEEGEKEEVEELKVQLGDNNNTLYLHSTRDEDSTINKTLHA